MWGYKAQPLIYVKIDKKRKHPTINMNLDTNRENLQRDKHIMNLEFNEKQIKLNESENDPICSMINVEVNKIQEILLN